MPHCQSCHLSRNSIIIRALPDFSIAWLKNLKYSELICLCLCTGQKRIWKKRYCLCALKDWKKDAEHLQNENEAETKIIKQNKTKRIDKQQRRKYAFDTGIVLQTDYTVT